MDQDNYVYEDPQQEGSWGEYVKPVIEEEVPYQMPFADPVYEVPYEPYQPKKPKKKRSGKPAGTVILCLVLAVVVAFGSSVLTAVVMNGYWQNQFENLTLAVNDKNAVMQEQINAATRDNGTTVRPNGAAAATGYMTPGQVYEQNVDTVVSIKNRIQRI